MNDLPTIQALERDGAILTDVLLTFRFDNTNKLPPPSSPRIHVNLSEGEDNEELVQLGGRIFTVDRFHGDPLLSKAKSSELYCCVSGELQICGVAGDEPASLGDHQSLADVADRIQEGGLQLSLRC